MTDRDNPLFESTFEIPFDRIRAEHVVPAIEHHLERANVALEAIESFEGPRNYENTLHALDRALEPLEWAVSVAGHLETVSTYPELRAAWNAVQEPISSFRAGIPLRPKLWEAVKAFSQTDEARSLSPTKARLLEKTIADFRRHGADLDQAGRERLEAIEVELAKITTRFAENVLDSTNDFELILTDESKLSGLPPRVVEAAGENAKSKGIKGWRFTLQMPSYAPLMTYLDDSELRERAWRAYSTRATSGERDNRPLIERILHLRREKASLLGYRDFADLTVEDRMAKTGRAAVSFIDDLREKTQPFFERENEALESFRRRQLGTNAGPMQPWDVGYWAEKQRQALHDLDTELLRPYFPFDACLQGFFEFAGRLFGVRVEERPNTPVWDETVRAYQLLDSDGTVLGAFYVDPFPRESKRGGAWMDALVIGEEDENRASPHLGLICANFNPPGPDAPSIIDHDELRTLFHEFGHLLHLLLSRVEVRPLAGTNVAWDFVELPSQIMEEWTWSKETLDLFARHYETGEALPTELLEKLLAARGYRAAGAMMRQLGFASMDLALHVLYDPEKDGDPISYSKAIIERHSPVPLPDDFYMVASFNHIFSEPVGYASGYYSYKWAEVLAADAFSRFEETGLMNAETGRSLRGEIFSRGDSREPMELFVTFVGREPRPEALLERDGLASGG